MHLHSGRYAESDGAIPDGRKYVDGGSVAPREENEIDPFLDELDCSGASVLGCRRFRNYSDDLCLEAGGADSRCSHRSRAREDRQRLGSTRDLLQRLLGAHTGQRHCAEGKRSLDRVPAVGPLQTHATAEPGDRVYDQPECSAQRLTLELGGWRGAVVTGSIIRLATSLASGNRRASPSARAAAALLGAWRNEPPRQPTGRPPVRHHWHPVYQDVTDACGVPGHIGWRGSISKLGQIENHDVGGSTFPQNATISKSHGFGR